MLTNMDETWEKKKLN